MKTISDKRIQAGLDKACVSVGDNAYFGNGFRMGVQFTLKELTEPDIKKDKKITITNTILYCKGWYKRTDLFTDLVTTLESDGYTPYTENDVMYILLGRLGEVVPKKLQGLYFINRVERARRVLIFTQDEEPTFERGVIAYCVELLMQLDSELWVKEKPDYNVLPERV